MRAWALQSVGCHGKNYHLGSYMNRADILDRFAYAILIATEISSLSQSFQFDFSQEYLQSQHYTAAPLNWTFATSISPAVWVTFALALILFINVLPVRMYGEIEYIFGCIKLIMMVLLIMYNVIMSGVNANRGLHPRFWTYRKPYGKSIDEMVRETLTMSRLLHRHIES